MSGPSVASGNAVPPYRVAVIGCGGIARAHANAYTNLPQCMLVAAADISRDALADFGRQYGVEHLYTSYEEMLTAERPDIVSVCTWPPLHAAPVIAAARAGVKGIICEKPMAPTLAEADRMNEAARAAGTVLIVGHQRRFSARYSQARQLIEAGTIGEVEEVLAICNGDLLTDGTHAVDLARFLVGDLPVAWVFGQVDLRQPTVRNTARVGYQQWQQTGLRYGHPIEGGALAQIQFVDGPRALLETGMAARPLGYQRFRILGNRGRIEISGDPGPDRPEFLRVWGHGEPDWRDVDLERKDAFKAQVQALLESITSGKPHLLSGTSARATLEVLIGIMESAFRHERVTLPISTADHPLLRHMQRDQAAHSGATVQ
jgi:predicted dehydrogenase